MMTRAFLLISFLAIASIAHAEPQLAEQESEKAYVKASTCYHNLMADEASQKQRANWEKCMSQFASVARDYAETARGSDALFTLAKMYRLLSVQSHNKEDAKEAYNYFDEFTDRYKKSRLYDDALYEMAYIKLDTFNDVSKAKRLLLQIIRWDPDGDRVRDAKALLSKLKSGQVKPSDTVPLKPQGAVLQNKPKALEPQVAPSTSSGRTGEEKKSQNP